MRRKLAAGNWKMHGDSGSLAEIDALRADHPSPGCDLLVCPPATLISRISARAADTPLAIGGQDCHAAESGAHTGDIAAAMLAEAGATYVILGHSERRAEHGEDDATVRAKAEAALAAGLIAVLCIGETEAQRDAGDTLAVLGDQLAGSVPDAATGANLVVAYEPVWAIGTGRVPSAGQIGEVHDFLRASLARRLGEDTGNAVRLLYGGSVKAANAAEIFAIPNVDGALVGGASLRAADFSPIVGALEESG